MKLLNDLYKESCKPKCESYKQISSHITLINNFFEDFEAARDFFINREKWKCIQYQGHDLPGYQSLFPSWIGKSLMGKYILDNKISDDMYSYKIECNFRYDNMCPWSLSNSDYFPHIDGVEHDEISRQICLINLNKVPVATDFYTYKNKEYCTSEILDEWQEYNKKLTSLRESKDNISEKIAYVNSYQYLDSLQKANHNKALEKLVLKRGDDDRIVEGEGELVQIVDPIYNDNYSQKYQMDCRSNFFSPVKYLFGIKFDTFWFNMGVIWVMCGALFASLHFNLLKSFISLKWVKKFTE
jgi:hypothetical protein